MTPQNFNLSGRTSCFLRAFRGFPSAAASIVGSAEYPSIIGSILFYQTAFGVIVLAEIFGLPVSDAVCKSGIFAFHLHSGSSCTGNQDDPFADALTHYNPMGCPHPAHAGDLPPIWGSSEGYAFEFF